jgi:hypothetical protein
VRPLVYTSEGYNSRKSRGPAQAVDAASGGAHQRAAGQLRQAQVPRTRPWSALELLLGRLLTFHGGCGVSRRPTLVLLKRLPVHETEPHLPFALGCQQYPRAGEFGVCP